MASCSKRCRSLATTEEEQNPDQTDLNEATISDLTAVWNPTMSPLLTVTQTVPRAVIPQILRPTVADYLRAKDLKISSLKDVTAHANVLSAHDTSLRRVIELHTLRRANAVAASLPHIVTLRIANSMSTSCLVELFQRACWHLIEIDFEGCPSVNDTAVAAIAKTMPSLTTFTASYCTNVDAPAIAHLQKLPLLTALDVSGRSGGTDDALLVEVCKLTGLKKLSLNGCKSYSPFAARRLTQLSCLEVLDVDHSGVAGDVLCRYIAKIPTLKELDIQSWYSLTAEGFEALAALPVLERLHVSGCQYDDSDDGADAMTAIGAIAQLRDLDVSAWSCQFDADTLQQLGRLKMLRTLDFSCAKFDETVTDEPFIEFVRSLPALTELDISHCAATGLSGELEPELSRQFPRIAESLEDSEQDS